MTELSGSYLSGISATESQSPRGILSKKLRCNKRLCIDEDTYNRIVARCRYGQIPCGVIKELLDMADQIEGVNHKDSEVKQ